MTTHKDTYYQSEYIFEPRRFMVWKEITRYLKKYIPKDGSVLDLGAGYCDFVNNIQAKTKYAVDISSELPNYASRDVKTIISPAWDLKAVADEAVDVVHASNLLEHFDDKELEKIMGEIKRVLKKDGKLILIQPNYRLAYKNYFDDPTHKKVFSDVALDVFLQMNGMKPILKMPRFLPFSMRSNSNIIPKFIFPLVVRLYIHSPWKPLAGQMLFVSTKL